MAGGGTCRVSALPLAVPTDWEVFAISHSIVTLCGFFAGK
jgi:hypothetical protein